MLVTVDDDVGSSSYAINDETVSWEQYEKALNEINIFPKLKNFLIFQGAPPSPSQSNL